jgi:hypothetical protein
MNERIRLLAEQAGGEFYTGFLGSPNSIQFKESDLEKFAELIVKECITKVEMRKKFAIEDEHIVDHAFDLLVYDLESHFGVRE